MNSNSLSQIEVSLPAACQWFLLDGKEIWCSEKKFHHENAFCGYGGKESELWKGKGWSTERWGFWRERLEGMVGRGELSESTREGCRRAGVKMGKVERAKK